MKTTNTSHRHASYQVFYLPLILSPFLGLRQGPIKAQIYKTVAAIDTMKSPHDPKDQIYEHIGLGNPA